MKDSVWQLARIREERFVIAYDRYEANKEFRRARLKAAVRLLVGALQRRREPVRARRGSDSVGSGFIVSIDEIVGRINPRGRSIRGLPPLRRAFAATWRHLFCRDVEEYPVLTVRSGPGGWYLAGDVASPLYLEIMRAKGWRRLRVVEAPAQTEEVETEGATECSECCSKSARMAS